MNVDATGKGPPGCPGEPYPRKECCLEGEVVVVRVATWSHGVVDFMRHEFKLWIVFKEVVERRGFPVIQVFQFGMILVAGFLHLVQHFVCVEVVAGEVEAAGDSVPKKRAVECVVSAHLAVLFVLPAGSFFGKYRPIEE